MSVSLAGEVFGSVSPYIAPGEESAERHLDCVPDELEMRWEEGSLREGKEVMEQEGGKETAVCQARLGRKFFVRECPALRPKWESEQKAASVAGWRRLPWLSVAGALNGLWLDLLWLKLCGHPFFVLPFSRDLNRVF